MYRSLEDCARQQDKITGHVHVFGKMIPQSENIYLCFEVSK